jgi:hypothetical protein
VVSVSYGQDEATVTTKYANRQCTEYAKLGIMGTTVLYSSGDDGVAGFGGVCLLPNGVPVLFVICCYGLTPLQEPSLLTALALTPPFPEAVLS